MVSSEDRNLVRDYAQSHKTNSRRVDNLVDIQLDGCDEPSSKRPIEECNFQECNRKLSIIFRPLTRPNSKVEFPIAFKTLVSVTTKMVT